MVEQPANPENGEEVQEGMVPPVFSQEWSRPLRDWVTPNYRKEPLQRFTNETLSDVLGWELERQCRPSAFYPDVRISVTIHFVETNRIAYVWWGTSFATKEIALVIDASPDESFQSLADRLTLRLKFITP